MKIQEHSKERIISDLESDIKAALRRMIIEANDTSNVFSPASVCASMTNIHTIANSISYMAGQLRALRDADN